MRAIRSISLVGAAVASLCSAANAETLRWGGARDIFSLDPYSYGDSYTISFLNHVYEGLVRYSGDLKLEPALAESWEIVSDDTWRFKLRAGVKFHNGADLTADDVVASLTRVSHPNSPLRGNLPAYKSAKKIDDLTVEITLVGPYPLLLNDLTNIHIFDADWLKDNNSEQPTDVAGGVEGFATFNANGTGPFKVIERVPDSKTTLEVNPDWWQKADHGITRIEFTPVASAATRVAALLSGEIDFTEGAPVQDLGRLSAAPGVKVMERADLRTVLLGFQRRETLHDGRPNPFNDLRVRQAVAHAIDLELLKARVMRGKSQVTGAIVAPEIPGWTPELDKLVPFDLEKAQALIKEAGVEGTEVTLVCTNPGLVSEEEICNALVSMLTRAGLKPSLDIGPGAVSAPKRSGGQADLYLIGWANEPMLDSYSILLQVIRSKNETGGVFNWGGWSYPEIDTLVDQAATEMDRDKRIALQTQALEIVKSEVVMHPLHMQPIAWATSARVESVVQQADNKVRHWLTHMAK